MNTLGLFVVAVHIAIPVLGLILVGMRRERSKLERLRKQLYEQRNTNPYLTRTKPTKRIW